MRPRVLMGVRPAERGQKPEVLIPIPVPEACQAVYLHEPNVIMNFATQRKFKEKGFSTRGMLGDPWV